MTGSKLCILYKYIIFTFVFSVSFRNIQSVPFPAVTVCKPGSGKWSAMVEALSQADKDDSIFETIELFEAFSKTFNDPFAPQLKWLVYGALGSVTLNHSIPADLDLFPIEKEVFYLINFACFAMGKTCEEEIIRQSESLVLASILRKDTREQTATELEEMICNKVNCSIKTDSNWMNCNNAGLNLMYQEWCKKCSNLSACLYPRTRFSDGDMVRHIVKIFYAWRKYFTQKNIIHALLTLLLDESYEIPLFEKWKLKVWTRKYIQRITPFSDYNLTLLDAWSYAYGDVFAEDDHTGIFEYTSKSIEALKSCSLTKDEMSCLLVDKFNQELGNENINLWRDIHEGLLNDFIPLCSYGAKNLELHHCTAFKKIDQDHCFTFNESSFAHMLGRTEGLNFLVNYDFPGTNMNMKEPFTIILHEPNQDPDISNIKGKNFFVRPGKMVDLKITTTVVDSTADFDAMSFESRQCIKDAGYGEVNCLMEHISNRAESKSDCRPWYIKSRNDTPTITCNTLGAIFYENSMRNESENLNDHEKCFQACQQFKYSLVLLEGLPMTDALQHYNFMKFQSFGEDFNNLFLRPEKLIQYRGLRKLYALPLSYLQDRLKRASLVHINFEELEALTVTKDAKITIPDMIGNIGGTLGVFIGFSFLRLLDDLVEFFQNLYRRQN